MKVTATNVRTLISNNTNIKNAQVLRKKSGNIYVVFNESYGENFDRQFKQICSFATLQQRELYDDFLNIPYTAFLVESIK